MKKTKKKHTLADAACWDGNVICEFLDDVEFDGWGFQYPAAEVQALSIPLYAQADWYAVGNGCLVAVEDDKSKHGRQIAVWSAENGWE